MQAEIGGKRFLVSDRSVAFSLALFARALAAKFFTQRRPMTALFLLSFWIRWVEIVGQLSRQKL